MPVWGEPMLARTVALLRSWGVDDIVVNCHYLHGQIEKWCAANGCRASYEPDILGTGGVLNPLREWIGGDDFYLVNGDIVFDGVDECPFSPPDALPPSVIGECLVVEDGPRTIEAEPEGNLVTCWQSPDPGCRGTFTYCGVARLSAAVLGYVRETGCSSIVDAYEKAMMDGRFMKAVQPASLLWTDAGTVASYMAVNSDGEDNAFDAIPQVKAAMSAAGVEPGRLSPVSFLGARGSDRCFFRLGDAAVAIAYDDSKRSENAKYAAHARWLASKGVPVPRLLADLPGMKTQVFEWAGVERKMNIDEYVTVLEALAKFNALDPAGLDLEPPFNAELWEWERNLFAEYCLGGRYHMECPPAVAKELAAVAERLDREPPALVHRDFQSSNVLWRNGQMSIIDFQGMRMGPAAYDLASLLYDPYVSLAEKRRGEFAAFYGKLSGRPESADVLPFAAVQRLAQALGAYGRLASVGQPQFGRYVLPALENMLAAADEAGLDAVGALAEDLIAREQPASAEHKHCGCGCGEHPETDS